jgi:hypothetical protein
MDNPVNAVYGRYDKPPEHQKPIRLWMIGAGVVLLFVLWSIFLTLPSGIPFLAAKFAGGFFSYIGLFFLYMMGFFLLLIGLAAGIAYGSALYTKYRSNA